MPWVSASESRCETVFRGLSTMRASIAARGSQRLGAAPKSLQIDQPPARETSSTDFRAGTITRLEFFSAAARGVFTKVHAECVACPGRSSPAASAVNFFRWCRKVSRPWHAHCFVSERTSSALVHQTKERLMNPRHGEHNGNRILDEDENVDDLEDLDPSEGPGTGGQFRHGGQHNPDDQYQGGGYGSGSQIGSDADEPTRH
jgi:hypothetical protein